MTGETVNPNPIPYMGEVTIDPQHIDRNRHVNNAAYQNIYQHQRELFLESKNLVISLGADFPIRFSGIYLRQAYEKDVVEIVTSANIYDKGSSFSQSMHRKDLVQNEEKMVALGNFNYHSGNIKINRAENEPPPLYIFLNNRFAEPRAVRGDGNPNMSYYFEEWERERTACLEALGFTAGDVENKQGLIFVMARYYGYVRQMLLPNQYFDLETSVEVLSRSEPSRMLFRQKMMNEGQRIASFECGVYTASLETDKAVNIPEMIVDAINNRNSQA